VIDPDVLAGINEGVNLVPYNSALGLVCEDWTPEGVTVRLPYKAELVGNPDNGVIHGGAITALIDATCGMAVFTRLETQLRIATLDLRIDYLKPATPPKDVRALAECIKITRHVAFVRATAYHDDLKDPIAAAAGTFVIFDDKQSAMAVAMAGREKK
jgi:uncharacterized protein (TIGR00369 family)